MKYCADMTCALQHTVGISSASIIYKIVNRRVAVIGAGTVVIESSNGNGAVGNFEKAVIVHNGKIR